MEGYDYEYQLQQNVETADRQEHEAQRPERESWGKPERDGEAQ